MFDQELHLFIFRRQGVSLRFAAADRDVVVGDHTYLAAQIERDSIRQMAERAKDKLKVRVAYSVAAAEPEDGWAPTQKLGNWWRPNIPADPITVVCMTWDPTSADPPAVEWMGWVMQPAFEDAQLELTCSPNAPQGAFIGQGPKWQRACFKVVHSTGIRGCNLEREPFEIATSTYTKAGLVVQSDDFIGTPFPLTYGWVWWLATNGFVESRPIIAHNQSTGQVTMLWDAAPPAEDEVVTALPNCPGTWAACEARRADPQNHYGGAIYKPVRDPILSGDSMSWG
jgi:hypothetical protein